jgi:hypothetical protein
VRRSVHAERTEQISKTTTQIRQQRRKSREKLKDKKERDSQERSKAPPSVAKEKRQGKCDKEKRRA